MAETSTYGADVHSDRQSSGEPDAAEAAREIKAWLAANETSKALITCNRMLSLRPGDRLFEGLRLEVENKAREIRVEFIRQLSAELEKVPDLDARIESIRQARLRYPSETTLSDLLENAIARRNLFQTLMSEARHEEQADEYGRAVERWHLLHELFPTIPGLDVEVRRVELLAETQKRMKRRSEFVDSIFQLSSTGDYTRALYQCINALAEYPSDGGLLTLKKSIEEKAEHATELQRFVADGLTFLQAREVEAALECFGKARAFDLGNLQVRYLIGIALLEKARLTMQADRRKLNLLLDEAKSFMPHPPELQMLTFEPDAVSDENWDRSLIRIEAPAEELQQHIEQTALDEGTSSEVLPPSEAVSPEPSEPVEHLVEQAREPIPEPTPEPPQSPESLPSPEPLPQTSEPPIRFHPEPAATRQNGFLQRLALLGLVVLGALAAGWFIYRNAPSAEKPAAVPSVQNVDIEATPAGAEIFIDDRKVGESRAQMQLTRGNYKVSVSLAGYEPRTLPLDLGTAPTALQVDLQPILMDVHVTSDRPDSVVWIDNEQKGALTDNAIAIPGVQPGVRVIKIQSPDSEIEFSFEFSPGRIPAPISLPPRQIAYVLFAGTADGKSRVECNCAPAGLRVGDFAEMIRAGGLEFPLEGQRAAELWIGKNRRKLTIHATRSPAVTIAAFSNSGTVSSSVEPGR